LSSISSRLTTLFRISGFILVSPDLPFSYPGQLFLALDFTFRNPPFDCLPFNRVQNRRFAARRLNTTGSASSRRRYGYPLFHGPKGLEAGSLPPTNLSMRQRALCSTGSPLLPFFFCCNERYWSSGLPGYNWRTIPLLGHSPVGLESHRVFFFVGAKHFLSSRPPISSFLLLLLFSLAGEMLLGTFFVGVPHLFLFSRP